MKAPTKRQWAVFLGHMLMVVPGTYVLKACGWKPWLAFLAWCVALRIAGYVEGQESR